jgi:hypothetical protein
MDTGTSLTRLNCVVEAYARGDGTRIQEEEAEMMTPIHVGPSRRGSQARMHDACGVERQKIFLYRFLRQLFNLR